MTEIRFKVSTALSWFLATVFLATVALLLSAHGAETLSEESAAERRDRAVSDPWVVYNGFDGPGKGKHVVLVSGDEEYRSEEALPQLGKILAKHHGFKCTVLFAVNPEDGAIDPDNTHNIPGIEALRSADLMIIATRFRDLPDEQMKYVAEYLDAGKPVIGMRAAVVAFRLTSPTYERFSCQSRTWKGGFGQQILGQTWISHHGRHGRESTRGLIAPGAENVPIVRGCDDVWGPTDVYTVRSTLANDSKVLMLGRVLDGMQPTDKPLEGPKNDPMMPVAWTRSYHGINGVVGRVFTTTMGAATDLESEGFRRLLVNATYWCVGLEEKIPGEANVETVGEYKPSPFGFGKYKKGIIPSEHAFGVSAAAQSTPGVESFNYFVNDWNVVGLKDYRHGSRITPELAVQDDVIHASGKRHYEPTWESLAQHGAAPEWYEDAVFGMYFHWGIYSVPAYGGEKYPRDMYKLNSKIYKHHCDKYGDPAEFGYHDFIPMFKAEKWDPDRWAKLFKNAGADFAGSIGEHHDGFAMWDTQYDQYNSMDMGPRRDVVGEMARAVRKQGMKVVTTFHHLRWDYYDAGRRLCPEGVGVNNPELSGLYGPVHEAGDPGLGTWLISGRIKRPEHHVGDPISESFREEGYNKFIEVIDKYRPDQLQIDGGTCVRLGQEGVKKVLAHYFNAAETWGKEVVVTRGYDSHHPYSPSKMWGKEVMIGRVIPLSCSVQNIERHFPKVTLDTVSPDRWQTSTPVPGFSWAYVASQEEKTPDQIEDSVNALVDGMVDMTSKNGVTLLGVTPKPDGTFPDSQVRILNKLGDWMRVNKEALHGTDYRIPCAEGTLRFTQKERYLYAIDLEKPIAPAVIPGVTPVPGSTIRMLGSDENLAWHQDDGNVVIDELPDPSPCDYAWAFRIRVGEATDKAQRAAGGKE